MNQEIINFINAAMECSLFICPSDPGLTYDEIHEICQRTGYQRGETDDALIAANTDHTATRKNIPNQSQRAFWANLFKEEPDYRNMEAFDFVIEAINERIKADGAAKAQIEKDVVIERAITKGISKTHIEVAIAYQVLSGLLIEKQGLLHFPHKNGVRMLPSQQQKNVSMPRAIPKPERARALPYVTDIINRRTDGRPKSAEPLDAFAEALSGIGYGNFRLWWVQTVAELRRGDAMQAPVSVSVLAAALVEGALTFAAKYARDRQLQAFRSTDFDKDPKTWKIDDLVKSAASGNPPVLSAPAKNRVDLLIRTRQRIHAGRMLSEHPTGAPDLRPEEARDAKATADQAVRDVLDWLQRNAPAS